MTNQKVFNILFLCTGNSARSIMAESILNSMGKGQFKAYSAGSHPIGEINPIAADVLHNNKLSTEGLRSKNWQEFAAPDAPQMDFIFTVCDQAASEVCPVWPGQPVSAHWGVPDPVAVEGSKEEKRRAFTTAFLVLNRRISLFLSLPLDKLDALSLKSELDDIGHQQAAQA